MAADSVANGMSFGLFIECPKYLGMLASRTIESSAVPEPKNRCATSPQNTIPSQPTKALRACRTLYLSARHDPLHRYGEHIEGRAVQVSAVFGELQIATRPV